ncbi:hypothetical protein BT93_C1225 [Corymbia citriodora subsp. variegata]|nr:hypothetical protein BT93_C1225 [Corymbia citriodora subsp. variegata]
MAGSFFTNVVVNLVSKLSECLFDPIGRHFGYVLCYKNHVEDLKNEVKELESARERVQHSVDEARNDAKPIYTDVEDWLGSVTKEAEEAQNLLECGKSAKSACFRSLIPNPVVRHPIGRKVKETTEVIKGLLEKSRNSNFKKVYYENTPSGIVAAATSATRSVDKEEDPLESRASIIDDVMKAIADDKIHVIGVYGPGGVGKSKLLEDIEQRVKQEKWFDVVVVANVSRNPDLKIIQGEIADALGLKLMNVETARGRANHLRERLERDHDKKIIIILDNLWKKLELKDVGIPCGNDNKVRGCKLLLSSRLRSVLRIDMGIDREFQLNELNQGEARRLFERIVEDKVNDIDFKPLVDGVVKNCGGLPLLILSVAKRLRHGDLAEWRNASNYIDVSDVKSLVELNYNDLKDERIKALFLICALHSGRISLRDSFIYCMGLSLFKKFSNTIENARDRLITDLHSLQDSSLLLDSTDMKKFRMHDIFVDAAISIFSTEWNALVGRKDFGFKEWSTHELRICTVISFSGVGIDKLPESLDCPNLRMLLLCEDNPSLQIPNSFFESMEKLEVLDLTGLSFSSLPSSIKFLGNLKSLSLDQCCLEDVTILGKLKGLQFLSFFKSVIPRLPKDIGELTELRFLDLTGCRELEVIEPGVLGSLVDLEELYMEDSFDKWEAEDEALPSNASLAELKNMKNLSTLCIAIPHSVNLSRGLPFGKLNRYKIQIGDKTQDLHLDGLQDEIDNIHDMCVEGFQELKHLHVQNSPSIQYVVHSSKNPQCTAFTRLESLFLKNLNNLAKICRGSLSLESFSKLKIVKVDNCGKIKHLFPFSMKRIILQLEEIEISRCCLMQQILTHGETGEDGDEIDNDTKVRSCNLCRLTLRNLPKMMSFCKTADDLVDFFDEQQVSLPWLESLTLSELPKLKEIWNSQFPSDVSNLKFLKVEDCASLMSIFPSNLVIKLQNLEAITIERCQLIRKVFDLEGLIANGDVEILSRLTTLTLSDLPRLEQIWIKNPRIALCFENLRVLKVQGCENLRFIFSSSMAKALQQIKEIKIVRCKLLKEIIDMQEEELEKAASMDTTEFPLLSSLSLEELPNLRTFSHGTHRIHCPILTRLRISGCPKMMTISSFKGKQQTITANAGLQQALGGVNSSLSLPILFDHNILFPSLEELTIVSCGLMKIWHNELSEESFRKMASITIRDCENLSHIFPSSIIEVFQSLKMIEVVNCTSLESLMEQVAVNTKKRPKNLVFLDLNEVKLWDLPRMDALVTSGSQPTLNLPSLTTVSLRNCPSLRYLFTYDTSRTLDKLEMLDVSDCNKMQEVVAMEESEEQKLKEVKFSRFHTLKLCSLHNLISFSSGSCAFEFPSLTNLSILECTELKAFIMRLPASRVETTNEGTASSDESPHSLFDEKVLFPSLEELKLSSMRQLKGIWHNKLHGQSFCKLASLTVELCENLSHIFPSNSMDRLQSLSKIEVVGCPSLEALFEPVGLSSEKRQKPLELSALKKMKLLNLPKLTDILKSDCEVTLTFPSLMEVNVRRCHSLSYLFSRTTAKTLHELVVLDVSYCNNLRGIIVMEEGKGKTVETFEFCHLIKLKLGDLKSLICFSSENCAGDGIHPLFDEKLAFPKLEELHIEGVQQEELWNNKILVESFCCLKVLKVKQCLNLVNVIPSFMSERLLHYMESLTVEECPCLRNLFTMSMAPSLGLLQYLGLGGCGEMEYIVTKEEEATDKIVIPRLVTLYLHNMPKLRSFCQGKHISEWPSLKEFTIEDCKAVKVILGDASCRKLEGSGPTHQLLLLVEKVEFHSMELMKISYMDNMEKIWLDELASTAFSKLKKLIVEHCEKLSSIFSSNTILWSGHPCGTLTFERLLCLKVENCKSLKSLFPVSIAKSMIQLEELSVKDCRLEEIIREEDGVGTNAGDLFFPRLTSLKLMELSELRSFYRNSHTLTWPLLKTLLVRHCGKMKTFSVACGFQSCQGTTTDENQLALFSFEKVIPNLEVLSLTREDVMMLPQHYIFGNLTMLVLGCYHDENIAFPSDFLLHGFPNLEVLLVYSSSFKEIFSEDALRHGGVTPCGGLTDMEKPLKSLGNLKRLLLVKLRNLRGAWKDGSLMVEILKQIEELSLSQCPSLSIIFPSSASFQRLTELYVHECAGLIHMGTCSAMTSMALLTRLTLRDCGAMEDVVTDDGDGAKEIPLPKLKWLILDRLPSLESFSQANCAFSFPSLEHIIITKCPRMSIFCKGASRTPNLHKVLLFIKDDEGRWEGDLNTTVRTLSTWNDPHRIQ